MTSKKLAILSDLHAAPRESDPKGTEIRLYSNDDMYRPFENPLASLHELISAEGLTANFVVCPGDMTNRAESAALRFVWAELHKLRQAFGASEVVATVGNHDVDSRGHLEDSFPREALMRLAPRFPIATAALADHFWAHGYYISLIDGVRFLVINSCWLHESRDLIERGAMTSYSLEKIRVDLAATQTALLNVAVCHHHPQIHSELALGADIMVNGQQFLNLLAETGLWLVIHGHKHHPKIEIAQGDFQQAMVLACGSFSGRVEGANATVSRNYFHLVDVHHDVAVGELRGKIQSWNWVSGLGWKEYGSANSAFPSRLGFGYAGNPKKLAQEIATSLGGRELMRWGDMLSLQPELGFVMPKRLTAVIDALRTQYNITVTYTDNGLPFELGVRSA